MKTERNLSLQQLKKYNTRSGKMNSRCKRQFHRNLASFLKKHPEHNGKVLLDPDASFSAEYSSKHCPYYGTVVAVSIDEKNYLRFDFCSQFENEKNLYLAEDAGYGIYIDDWPWALQVLLETFDNPYTPDSEE